MTLLVSRLEVPAMLPSVIDLMGIPADDPIYFDRVLNVVIADAGLASHAFRYANTAAFTGMDSIHSLRNAVMRIGPHRFVARILASQLARAFQPRAPELRTYWRHALLTAVANRRLASDLGASTASGEEAFVCGLLHNVGGMVIAHSYRSEYCELLRQHAIDSPELRLLERLRFGDSHVEVGIRLAKSWHLPDTVTQAIRGHHAADDHVIETFSWIVMATRASIEVAAVALTGGTTATGLEWPLADRAIAALTAAGWDVREIAQVDGLVADIRRQAADEAASLGLLG